MAEEKEERTFYCKRVELHERWVWRSKEYIANPDEDSEHEYLCNCPICGAPTGDVDHRYYGRWKGWQNCAGPKTEKGKARSRLNGWKHGGAARQYHMIAPALPGKFSECETCNERDACENEPYKYCPVILAPMMHFLQAFNEGNIEDLRDFAGMNQMRLFQTVQMMFREIQKNGTMVERWREVSKGEVTTRESLGFEANPLITKIIDAMQALGHTAEQQMATPKVKQDDDTIKGFLNAENDKSIDLSDYKAITQKRIMMLEAAVRKGNLQAANDPAMQRYSQEKEKDKSDDENDG